MSIEKSTEWVREHYAFVFSILGVIGSTFGFMLLYFASIQYVDSKHAQAMSNDQAIKENTQLFHEENKRRFDRLDKRLDEQGSILREVYKNTKN